MVTGVANLRPRRVGLRCVGFDHLVKRDQKEMVERSGPRSRERGALFAHAPDIADLFIAPTIGLRSIH
jgi:hypothetical protein